MRYRYSVGKLIIDYLSSARSIPQGPLERHTYPLPPSFCRLGGQPLCQPHLCSGNIDETTARRTGGSRRKDCHAPPEHEHPKSKTTPHPSFPDDHGFRVISRDGDYARHGSRLVCHRMRAEPVVCAHAAQKPRVSRITGAAGAFLEESANHRTDKPRG